MRGKRRFQSKVKILLLGDFKWFYEKCYHAGCERAVNLREMLTWSIFNLLHLLKCYINFPNLDLCTLVRAIPVSLIKSNTNLEYIIKSFEFPTAI